MTYIGRRYTGNAPCFAFVGEWLRDHGLDLPDYDYAPAEHAEALRRHLEEHGEPVHRPQPGDVVLLNQGGQPCHIGVMVTETEFLHHNAIHGVVRESTRSVHWRSRIGGYFRPRVRQSAAG